MSRIHHIIRFTVVLAIINSAVCALHWYVLEKQGFNLEQLLFWRAYIVNFSLVLMIFIILQITKTRFKASLGFIFMAGSLIKFAGFFTFFYHHYLIDGDIDKPEFLSFFIPYAASLIYETYYLVAMLNREEN